MFPPATLTGCTMETFCLCTVVTRHFWYFWSTRFLSNGMLKYHIVSTHIRDTCNGMRCVDYANLQLDFVVWESVVKLLWHVLLCSCNNAAKHIRTHVTQSLSSGWPMTAKPHNLLLVASTRYWALVTAWFHFYFFVTHTMLYRVMLNLNTCCIRLCWIWMQHVV